MCEMPYFQVWGDYVILSPFSPLRQGSVPKHSNANLNCHMTARGGSLALCKLQSITYTELVLEALAGEQGSTAKGTYQQHRTGYELKPLLCPEFLFKDSIDKKGMVCLFRSA